MTQRGPVYERLVADLLEREAVGWATYARPLDPVTRPLLEWAREAYSEALDMAAYLGARVMRLEAEAERVRTILARARHEGGLGT